MTGVREIDLVSEHEKAKANVAMLDSILAMKKQKNEQQMSLSKSQAEVKSLSTNLQATKTDLDNLKASLTKDEEEHRAKAEKWRAKNIKIQSIIFNADLTSEDSPENEEDLEGVAHLAEENAALFRQKLALRQFSSKVKGKSQEITSLESSLSKKVELQSIVENQLNESTTDFYKGMEEYRQKLQTDLHSLNIAIGLGSQIKCLSPDIEGKEGTIKGQNTKSVKTEEVVKSKNDSTDSQQVIIAPLCSYPDIPAPKGNISNEIQLHESYQRGRKDVFKQMIPLAEAGHFIRGRRLEWEKNTKNQNRVELGNKASHYGMALADATLYQSFCKNKRNDPEIYIAFYGLDPEFTWKNQECTLLLHVLDWRGDMKDFYPPVSQHRTTYPETTFSKLCDALMASINAELATWTVASLNKYLKDSEKGAQLYKDLKTHHAAGAIMHETYLKNKRVN